MYFHQNGQGKTDDHTTILFLKLNVLIACFNGIWSLYFFITVNFSHIHIWNGSKRALNVKMWFFRLLDLQYLCVISGVISRFDFDEMLRWCSEKTNTIAGWQNSISLLHFQCVLLQFCNNRSYISPTKPIEFTQTNGWPCTQYKLTRHILLLSGFVVIIIRWVFLVLSTIMWFSILCSHRRWLLQKYSVILSPPFFKLCR